MTARSAIAPSSRRQGSRRSATPTQEVANGFGAAVIQSSRHCLDEAQTAPMDRQAVHHELEHARSTFHDLHARASRADLKRRSDGTRWNNQQLLFHMLLGYLIIRALGNLVRLFGRLPPGVSRGFAAVLDAGTRPFDLANYLGSWAGGTALGRTGQTMLFDRVIAALRRRLDTETDADLARGMHYPTRWDPFFTPYMTLADVYRFPTQHFDFHRQQLTLETTETT